MKVFTIEVYDLDNYSHDGAGNLASKEFTLPFRQALGFAKQLGLIFPRCQVFLIEHTDDGEIERYDSMEDDDIPR